MTDGTALSLNGSPLRLPRALQPARYFNASRRWWKRLFTNERAIREYLESNPLKKLHIGGGHNVHPGWLNADIDPVAPAVIYLDATRSFPFDDKVFDYVFSEHMIEHVPYAAARKMLDECHRVLKPGGRIRIATPDFSALVGLYHPYRSKLQEDYLKWSIEQFVPEADSVDPVFAINNFVRCWGHQFIYDEGVITRALRHAGFDGILKQKLNESDDVALRGLEHVHRMPAGFLELESMVFEAVRE